jgi:hypothetical protein
VRFTKPALVALATGSLTSFSKLRVTFPAEAVDHCVDLIVGKTDGDLAKLHWPEAANLGAGDELIATRTLYVVRIKPSASNAEPLPCGFRPKNRYHCLLPDRPPPANRGAI